MKIAFLSRYQKDYHRGVEVFVEEITKRLGQSHKVSILSGKEADSLTAIFKGEYDLVIPTNGRWQAVKMSLGRLIGHYKLLISGHSGIGRDDILNLLVRPDAFVALTETAFRWAKSWSLGTRIYQVPNGVDLDKFKPQGNKIDFGLPKPVILSVGTLEWYKYHDLAIEAVAKLTQGSLMIVGRGPLENFLKRKGQRLLDGRFKIMEMDYSEMSKVYRSADLFTLPSWGREAFGLVYLEAIASGLGVVGPNDANRREIIGNAGILVDVFNKDQYSNALKRALAINWQARARHRAKQFSWDKVSTMYERIFEEVVKR